MANVVSVTPMWVHSWHAKNDYTNTVGVKEKIMTEYDDGTVTYEDNLRLYEDPIRTFWVTKPEYQNHEYKKEFELVDKCDLYTCRDSELIPALSNAIGVYNNPRRPQHIRRLCSNPYVYGADMEVETLIKQHYTKKCPVGKVAKFTTGSLDIETETTGQKRITHITYSHEKKVYTGVLKEYAKEYMHSDFMQIIEDLIGPFLRQHGYELELKFLDTELDLIAWTFERIHFHKTDFIGVWNLGFDFPKILERLHILGVDPASIMCHPDVPRIMRYVEWKIDQKEHDHFTDAWHWATIAGYSQFIDSMCLYARLRKVSGRDSSYSLDAISTKELGTGKLHFDAITNHWYMLNNMIREYTAYNIIDVVLLRIMEEKNNDMAALSGLVKYGLLSQFAKQTVMVRNFAYVYARERGRIPASVGTNMFTEYDKMLDKPGGTVLSPNKAVGVFIPVLEEMNGVGSMVSIHDNDLDFKALYPTITASFNISKETMLAVILNINGHDQIAKEYFFNNIQRPEINSVPLCHHFYGMPDYQEMDQKYRQHLNIAA